MTTFKVPESEGEAIEQLGNIGRRMDALTKVMTARKWERAALVACLVGPPVGHGPGRGYKGSSFGAFPYTVKALAALGIHGLSSPTTINGYRDAWCRDGRTPPDFGDVIDLDALPEWTGTYPERPVRTTPASTPEPEEQEYDTEAAAVRQAKVDGTLRFSDQPADPAEYLPPPPTEEAEGTVVRMRTYDEAHLNIDRARELLRNARRSRDEDYPHLNTMQLYGVRGALTEMRGLIEELMPVIEKDGEPVQEGSSH